MCGPVRYRCGTLALTSFLCHIPLAMNELRVAGWESLTLTTELWLYVRIMIPRRYQSFAVHPEAYCGIGCFEPASDAIKRPAVQEMYDL